MFVSSNCSLIIQIVTLQSAFRVWPEESYCVMISMQVVKNTELNVFYASKVHSLGFE